MAVPQYKLTTRFYGQADGTASPSEHAIGEIILWSGIPSRTWLPLNPEAVAALAAINPPNITNQDRWSGW
jgi:hypothetical protein